jgi:hypothetical protein
MTANILVFQALVWLLTAWFFVQSGRASIFHPFSFYLAFHGVVFVIRPIMERVFAFENVFFYMGFYPSEEQLQQALFLTTAALVAFAAVSWALDTAPRPARPIADGFNGRQWWAFIITVVLLAPLILYSVFLAIMSSTNTEGTDLLIQTDRDVDTGIMTLTNTTGYLVDAEKMLGTLCLMLIWGTRFRLWSFAPLIIYLGERAYEGWARWTIVLTLVSLALLHVARSGRRWVPAALVVLSIPVYMLFQGLGENRDAFKELFLGQMASKSAVEVDRSWIERQDNLDFANFDYLTYVMDVVPEKSGTYTYFTQYLQLFTEPVPRVLWPHKPIGPPIQLVNMNDYGNFVGLTVSLVGDGWISAGWLGVILTMVIVAYAVGSLHRWFWRREVTTFKVLVYCTFLPLTLQWYRDGSISIAKFVLFTIAPILIWQVIVSRLHAKAGSSIGQPRRESLPDAARFPDEQSHPV